MLSVTINILAIQDNNDSMISICPTDGASNGNLHILQYHYVGLDPIHNNQWKLATGVSSEVIDDATIKESDVYGKYHWWSTIL